MRPGGPCAQKKRHVADDLEIVEARANLASGVGRGRRIVIKPETAAGEIGLAVARRVEQLRLQRRVRGDADDARGAVDRHAIAIPGLDASGIALSGEARGELVVDRDAAGRKPMVGEGECGRHIGRAHARRAMDAGLEFIAPAAAET